MFNTNDLDDFNVDFEDESLFSGNNVASLDRNNQSDSSASKIVSSQFVLRTTKQPNNDIHKDVLNVNIENPKNSGNRTVTSSDFLNNLLNESGSSHSEKRKLENVIPEKNLKNKIAQQRKFPGPAGLLPDKPIKDLKNVSLILDPEVDEFEGEKESVILYSQTSASIFEEPPYLKLLSDFDMNKAESPLHKYTIEWVKKKVVTKMFIGKKIPFLALVLQQLDHSTPDPVVTFRDPTGEIDGILHRDAWNDMGHKFHPGAALALRQVGVLSISRQQVYLNITMNNILSIYTALDDSQDAEKNCINEMSSYDLLKSIDDWQAQEQAQSSTETPERNNASNNSLFSCINSHNSPNLLKRKLNQSTPIKKPNLVTNKSEPITKKVSPKCDFDISMDDINFDEFSDEKTSEKNPNTSSSVINFKPPDSKTKEKRPGTDLRTITAGIKFAPCDNRPAFLEPNKETNNSVVKPKLKPNPIFSQVLTQEESQMVEEVLDGIDFDEF